MEKKEKISKRKKKKSNIGFFGVLAAAFIVIVAVNIALNSGNRLETTIVREGAEEVAVSTDGYIFREQTVINAPATGYLYCACDENARVSSGEVVMYVYKNEVNLAATGELKAIDDKIAKLSAGGYSADIFSNDAAKVEQTVAQSLAKIPSLAYSNDLEAISELGVTVNELIEKRRVISGEAESADTGEEIERLKAQRSELEAKYNIERTMVHSPTAGAFTARLDGYEEMLDASALEAVDKAYIEELDKLSAEPAAVDKAEKGEPIGKIVNNFDWWVAVCVSEEEADGLQSGSVLNMRFPDVSTGSVSATVSKASDNGDGTVLIVLSCSEYVESIYSISKAKVELIKECYNGFKIPAKSLRMTDGKMGVYVIKSGKARFIPVELLYNGKSWVVVSEASEEASLKLYDELIVSGENIYDGKVVR